jgi:phage gp29-like protein
MGLSDDNNDDDDDDDDVYLRLQHGKEFHNLVYMSYVKHTNPAKRHNHDSTCIFIYIYTYIDIYMYTNHISRMFAHIFMSIHIHKYIQINACVSIMHV